MNQFVQVTVLEITSSRMESVLETGDTIPELSIPPISIPILIVSILGSWQVRYDTYMTHLGSTR